MCNFLYFLIKKLIYKTFLIVKKRRKRNMMVIIRREIKKNSASLMAMDSRTKENAEGCRRRRMGDYFTPRGRTTTCHTGKTIESLKLLGMLFFRLENLSL